MAKIIYCTFESCDLADLAAGRLRREFPGIQDLTIQTNNGPKDESIGSPAIPVVTGTGGTGGVDYVLGGIGIYPVKLDESSEVYRRQDDYAPSNASMKVVCPDRDADPIISRMINLGAQKINVHS